MKEIKINENVLTQEQYLAQILARAIHSEVDNHVFKETQVAYDKTGNVVGGMVKTEARRNRYGFIKDPATWRGFYHG